VEGLFAPWHLIVVAVVGVLMFGSDRLPEAARSLGQSMRILRSETRGDGASATSAPEPLFDVHTGERLRPGTHPGDTPR
jgi:sec-independent protein translocase protein TatA